MLRYLGSKTLLVEQIKELIGPQPEGAVFCDPFGGIGTVGSYMKQKGFKVISGDLLHFAHYFQKALIQLDATPSFSNLVSEIGADVEGFLNKISVQQGWLVKSYCEERSFFTRENAEHIQDCQKRLVDAVQFMKTNDRQHLISSMADICQRDSWHQHEPSLNLDTYHHFLNRSLSYERIRLGIEDGCVVDTIEEAFPTVLEIIRNCSVDNYLDNIRDQAGRAFRELPNFKVVVKKPSSKHVPEYYEEEKEQLESYYKSVFGDENGFFQKHLTENGQYEFVLKHITNLITKDGIQYATRRAILIVPHIIENPEDITPLGLVSVYIAPRMLKNDVILDFTFTWRTVEAMVGFPYSLYASVKYAGKILESVKNICLIDQVRRLKMGTLSYLAYSFHMFLDKPYTQIIRGIINDASI